MTPREMSAEEVEAWLRTVEENGTGVSAIRAHLSALRARAETAEADNAALRETGDRLTGLAMHDEGCSMLVGDNTDRCDCAVRDWRQVAQSAHPGTGYRDKVRAELLRELAKEQREAAAACRESMPERAAHHDATADGYGGQAAREEQG